MATYWAIAQAQRKERRSGSRSNLAQHVVVSALLTVAAHREEVLGRPPTSTSSYALTYGAAETSSYDGQAEAAYPSCGRNHTCGEVLTAKPRNNETRRK